MRVKIIISSLVHLQKGGKTKHYLCNDEAEQDSSHVHNNLRRKALTFQLYCTLLTANNSQQNWHFIPSNNWLLQFKKTKHKQTRGERALPSLRAGPWEKPHEQSHVQQEGLFPCWYSRRVQPWHPTAKWCQTDFEIKKKKSKKRKAQIVTSTDNAIRLWMDRQEQSCNSQLFLFKNYW